LINIKFVQCVLNNTTNSNGEGSHHIEARPCYEGYLGSPEGPPSPSLPNGSRRQGLILTYPRMMRRERCRTPSSRTRQLSTLLLHKQLLRRSYRSLTRCFFRSFSPANSAHDLSPRARHCLASPMRPQPGLAATMAAHSLCTARPTAPMAAHSAASRHH
jgi:hypothetical protein